MSNLAARLAQVRDLIENGLVKFDYEALLEKHYRRWIAAGDTVIDVGAHSGRHLRNFIACVGANGRVIAFEPLPDKHAIIRKKYHRGPVSIHRIALSDEQGESTFTYARGTPQESGLKRRIYNFPKIAKPTEIKVRVDKLDSYTKNLESLSFIKIDTEGGEIGCLRGAGDALTRLRPVASVEYGYPSYSAYGHTKDDLYDLAEAHDYVLYDIFLNPLRERSEWALACDSIYWDFFMVPTEKQGAFLDRVSRTKS